jgi:hypothetical protein
MTYFKPKREDNWYLRNGVEPPAHEEHLSDEELAKIFKDLKDRKHGPWQQQGNVITCRSCANQHSMNIPIDVMLQGTAKTGMPILERMDLTRYR